MRQTTTAVLVALLVSGCGFVDRDVQVLNGHVREYERTYDTEITFNVEPVAPDSDKRVGADGNCHVPRDGGEKSVFISRDAVSDWGLVYHELSHCRFDLAHDDEMTTIDGETVPKSIMHSRPPSRLTLIKHDDYYVSELRAKIRKVRRSRPNIE
ncbi:MAG: hypothetical protein ABEN55_00415 [Bradymonadaceae bacterium]